MLKSMTAFGRASSDTSVGHFTVEIQSVNRKYLETTPILPKELSRFDPDIRKWVNTIVGRGQVAVRVSATYATEAPFKILPNQALAKQYRLACDAIAEELGQENTVSLEALIAMPGVLEVGEELENLEQFRNMLKETFDAAAEEFNRMRCIEGKVIEKDILERLQKLIVWIEEIEKSAMDAPGRYRDKLVERLEEFLPGSPDNEEALLREIVVYASKVDYTEEIVRFKSHLAQFREFVLQEAGTSGKTLDFLIQELNRETNTMGSKAADASVAQRVIGIKSELEKIREQVQNIE